MNVENFIIIFIVVLFLLLLYYVIIRDKKEFFKPLLFNITLLVILLSIGADTIKSISIKYGELSISRHVPTEEEKKNILRLINEKDFNIEDFNNLDYIENAENRSLKERSDLDFLLLSTKYWKNKNYEKALRFSYFGLYITSSKMIESYLKSRIGTIYTELKQYDISILLQNNAIYTYKDSFMAYYNLGSLLNDIGEKEKAIKAYDEASKIDVTNIAVKMRLASILNSLKRFDEANLIYEGIKVHYPEREDAMDVYIFSNNVKKEE